MIKRLYKIAGTRGSDGLNSCPTVIGDAEDHANVLLQGEKISDETRRELNIPDGEDVIVMPRELVIRGARRMTEDG